MKNGICPRCKSQSVYGKRDGIRYGVIPGVSVETSIIVSPSPVESYICTTCGYFENYVADQGKLADVQKKWKRITSEADSPE